ncbi:cortical actin cytoskeleton protein asp1 [Pseudozyma hubeiensis SY62]|uniref:Cortical actin cytoskeleton protein asp1 n=1 Tax=Pseudozyma hubeiensis (strain SY62) TaxID=1305764 RepID=R9PDP3_PSEHS|nr:cortical actin cytoskeleton protein asp1 [Pseudozyma hubeiensis SY62]GAC99494.1 cortical actin cytoskeleton protein asp1 [Pseudozyma hubeiensis SY62]
MFVIVDVDPCELSVCDGRRHTLWKRGCAVREAERFSRPLRPAAFSILGSSFAETISDFVRRCSTRFRDFFLFPLSPLRVCAWFGIARIVPVHRSTFTVTHHPSTTITSSSTSPSPVRPLRPTLHPTISIEE